MTDAISGKREQHIMLAIPGWYDIAGIDMPSKKAARKLLSGLNALIQEHGGIVSWDEGTLEEFNLDFSDRD